MPAVAAGVSTSLRYLCKNWDRDCNRLEVIGKKLSNAGAHHPFLSRITFPGISRKQFDKSNTVQQGMADGHQDYYAK